MTLTTNYQLPTTVPSFVFFGTGPFARKILEELFLKNCLPIAVVTNIDTLQGRHLKLTPSPVKEWAQANGIKIIEVDKLTDLVEFELQQLNHEVQIVSDFGKIIPKNITSIPKYGTLVTHQSLLPKYRGTSPIQYAILGGDTETGVSIITCDEKVDAGKVLMQSKIELTGTETSGSLEATLAKLGGEMLSEIIPNVRKYLANAKPQDSDGVTFSKKIEKEDACLDPELVLQSTRFNLVEIEVAERKVRAYNPSPLAYTILKTKTGKDIRVQILKAKIENEKFVPVQVKPEGKKEMSWNDFKRGNL